MKKAFTLIELLVVIAIIAILAAILFPVFAQAKTAAKITSSLSGMKQVALGLHIYSGDYDDVAVHEYGTDYLAGDTWVGDIYPYVKNRSIFFDKTIAEPTEDSVVDGEEYFADPFYPGYYYHWTWITNFSLNTDGYSRAFGGSGCEDIDWGTSSQRSLTSFEDISRRLAVAPTRYAQLPYSWMRFYGIDAAWPTMDRYATEWDWNQLIWDGRRQYGNRFIGAFADGHAGKFGPGEFISYYADNPGASQATTMPEFCAAMTDEQWDFWGRPWSAN